MSRQANAYEKALFEIIREFHDGFYYQALSNVVDKEGFKVKISKEKLEMIGKAEVTTDSGQVLEYKIMYNRIMNVKDGYTLLVPGIHNG